MIARINKILTATAAALTAAALTSGVAAAYWTTQGSGSGSATNGTLVAASTATPSLALTAALSPGKSADLIVRIKNDNAYPVKISSITGNGTITASGGIGTCTTTGVSFAAPSAATLDALPSLAASSTTDITLTDAVSMSLFSQSGCQGATFTVPVSIAVKS